MPIEPISDITLKYTKFSKVVETDPILLVKDGK